MSVKVKEPFCANFCKEWTPSELQQCCVLLLCKCVVLCNGRLSGTIEGSRLTGKIHCSQNYAHLQNYVNNGNLPGRSAATYRWKVSY